MGTKEKQANAPSSSKAKSSDGKDKKKKWVKNKNNKEKKNNEVLFDQESSLEKRLSEVANFKLITVPLLSERLGISGSLARKVIQELMSKNAITAVSEDSTPKIYTRNSTA
uniref:40S ribosomal protein S25 n=1 Tax=Nelumbo nucifera TaxID=4432 RepID=A0A822ZBQ7_NELNU|nr:TPA_asm: hypothetical protein HUJ06_000792 [Nelumbo nucifera]